MTAGAAVVLSTGPGQHAGDLEAALRDLGRPLRVYESWPGFRVREWGAGEADEPRSEGTAGWVRPVSRAVWAAWRRIPVMGRRETPRWWLHALHDRLVRRRLGEPALFVGWSQVSLLSLRATRARGGVGVLEHPTSHVDEWMRVVREELDRWGTGRGCHALFPDGLVGRMKAEYEVADRIVVLSAYAARTFEAAGAGEGVVAVPPGVDLHRFRPSETARGVGSEPDRRPLRLLYVGRLELLKGLPYLLEAVGLLEPGTVELDLVGPVLPEMEPVLERLAGPGVRIRGAADVREVPARYREADALVLPSLSDAFGLVVLEAMASGIPVITTGAVGAAELVRDGEDGFVVPVRDPEALAERIERLAARPDERRAMGRAARETAEAYPRSRYRERIARLHGELLEDRR